MSVRPSFLSALVSSLRSTIRAVSPPFGEEPCCSIAYLASSLEPHAPPIAWRVAEINHYAGLRSDTHIRCRNHLWPLPGLLIINIHFTLFLYKERRQLWNITVNRYITINNMQVQFIRFRQKISPLFQCFIQVMFYSMQ